MRETETQLLPDVGAIVTCKVCNGLRYYFSVIWWSDELILHSLDFKSIFQRGGLSWAVLFFAWTGDQHQPQVRQGPHPLCRLHTAEGPLQRNNQVTGKKNKTLKQCVVSSFSVPKTEPAPSDSTGKKMCVQQRKTRCVWIHIFNQTITSYFCCFTN